MVDELKIFVSGIWVKSIVMFDVDDFKWSIYCICDEINGSELYNECFVVRRFVFDVVDNESMVVFNGFNEI